MQLIQRSAFIAAILVSCSSNGGSPEGAGGAADGGSGVSGGAPNSVGGSGSGAGGTPAVIGGAGSSGADNGGMSPAAGAPGSAGTSNPAAGAAGSAAGSAGAGGHPGGSAGSAGNSSAGAGGGSSPGGASGGCMKPIVRPSPNAQQMMDVGGTMRSYLLDVPASADNQTPLALIFALHGANMTNTQVVGSFDFGKRSNGKAITVYPQGDQTSSGARWTSNETNWTYIQTLMTDLESRYCIDTKRVFLTGFSMGGGFTMDTACQKSTWFRAFATVEGYGPGGVSAATKPVCSNADAKAALLIIQGSTDGTVTPAMGQASLAFWTGKNGCSASTSMPMGAGFTSCTANSDCTSSFPVYYCTGDWMHTITSTAAADVWAFFSTFK